MDSWGVRLTWFDCKSVLGRHPAKAPRRKREKPLVPRVSNDLNSLNNGAMGGGGGRGAGGGVGGTSVHRLRNGLLKNSDLKVYTALFVYNLVIGYSKRGEKIIRLKAFDKKKKIPNQVLGTVLQCSYFSVISRFPLKTVQRYQNFLAVLPPHSIQSWNSEKNSGYLRPTLFVGWGKGLDLCVPMMIVWKRGGKKKGNFEPGFSSL